MTIGDRGAVGRTDRLPSLGRGLTGQARARRPARAVDMAREADVSGMRIGVVAETAHRRGRHAEHPDHLFVNTV